jgi:hypothetical protein
MRTATATAKSTGSVTTATSTSGHVTTNATQPRDVSDPSVMTASNIDPTSRCADAKKAGQEKPVSTTAENAMISVVDVSDHQTSTAIVAFPMPSGASSDDASASQVGLELAAINIRASATEHVSNAPGQRTSTASTVSSMQHGSQSQISARATGYGKEMTAARTSELATSCVWNATDQATINVKCAFQMPNSTPKEAVSVKKDGATRRT